jgi:hypothetical protein
MTKIGPHYTATLDQYSPLGHTRRISPVRALVLSAALAIGFGSAALAAAPPNALPHNHPIHGIIIHRCHWHGRIVPCRRPVFHGMIVHRTPHPPNGIPPQHGAPQ